jgi:hypothetical protein
MTFPRAFALRSSSICVLLAAGAVAVVAYVPVRQAFASDEVEIELSIKDHKFEPQQIKIPASKGVKLSVKNLDASPEEFESHELGVEKVIPGNSAATIRLKPLNAGTYLFFGEYHEATAQGHILVE